MDFKFNHFVFFITILTLSTYCYSSESQVFIATGPIFSKLSNNSLVPINNEVTNAYYPQNRTKQEVFFGFGAQQSINSEKYSLYQYSVGAAGYFFHIGEFNGVEFPLINAGRFDTLNYSFKAKSTTALAETRLFYAQYKVKPYILIGLGMSWNRLYDYKETPSVPELSAASAINFRDYTETSFSYELGAGINYLLWEDRVRHLTYTCSLGYQYFNLGSATLGNLSYSFPNTFKVNKLHTQSAVFSLTLSF